jgi:hypothetical protein
MTSEESQVLERLAETVRAQGGLLAEAGGGDSVATRAPAPHGAAAAAGPRAAADPERYELLVEAIREGYLLHYCQGRVLAPDDPDLALLAGDQLYALGLAELAALGDLDAVRELADVISLAAQAQAAADEDLAEAVWDAGATAVGWGTSAAHEQAKALARGGDTGAAEALRAAARQARSGPVSG